jgi:acetylornithine deacetylase
LPGWSVADCQAEIRACVSAAAHDHRFLSNNPPDIEWSGFLSEGYELKNSADAEAAFGKAYRHETDQPGRRDDVRCAG